MSHLRLAFSRSKVNSPYTKPLSPACAPSSKKPLPLPTIVTKAARLHARSQSAADVVEGFIDDVLARLLKGG